MSWIIAAHRCELATPGDFRVLDVRPEAQIVVANFGGTVHAVDNRCPHRGARIWRTASGNRPATCDYHARTWAPEHLTRYVTQWVGDWMLVERPGLPTEPVPAGIRAVLESTPAGLRLHGEFGWLQQCDVPASIENTLEAEHVAPVHGLTLGVLGLERTGLHMFPDGSSHETFRAADVNLDRLARFFPAQAAHDYQHAHLFPQSCISSTRGWTWSLQLYTPAGPRVTRGLHRMYAAPTTRPLAEFFDGALALNRRVFLEDAAVVHGIPPGFRGHLGPHDKRIEHYRAALQAAQEA